MTDNGASRAFPADQRVMLDIPGKVQDAVAAAGSVLGAAVTPKLAGPGQPQEHKVRPGTSKPTGDSQ